MYNPCDMILGFVRTCGMPQMASSKGKPMINTQIEGIRVPFFQTKYDMVGNTGVFQGSKHTKNVKKTWFPLENRSTHDRVAILVFFFF